MKSASKVLITEPIAREGTDFLRKYYEVVLFDEKTMGPLKNALADIDAVIVRSARLDAKVLSRASKLKVIARHGVGVDNVDIPYSSSKGILVTNTPEANIHSVAEHVITLIGMLAKDVAAYDRDVRNGNFTARNLFRSREVRGKTLGLIGLGKIGSLVAKKSKAAFEMNVAAFDPLLNDADFAKKKVARASSLAELLSLSDFVSVHVPLTRETRGLIGTKELEMMRKSAFLVDVCRGGIVNEKALWKSLKDGGIKGAAMDVFDVEPPGKDHPFLGLSNIILTPHIGGLTQEAVIRMAGDAANAVDRVLRGKAPKGLVNPEAVKIKHGK